jgi:hypothetical protein
MNTQPFPKSFPPVDDLVNTLSSVDYKKRWNQLVIITAELVAILVAIVIFVYSSIRKFWNEHGDDIIAFLRKVYTFSKDAVAAVQLWWEVNGEDVKNRFASAVLWTYNSGRAARVMLSRR